MTNSPFGLILLILIFALLLVALIRKGRVRAGFKFLGAQFVLEADEPQQDQMPLVGLAKLRDENLKR